jgi:phytanoyl-CoA hydroxylase
MVLEKMDLVMQSYKRNGYYLAKRLLPVNKIKQAYEQIIDIFRIKNSKKELQGDDIILDLAKYNFDSYVSCAKAAQQNLLIHQLGACDEMFDMLIKLSIVMPSINMRPVLLFSSPHLSSHKFYWRADPHQDYSGMMGSLDGIVAWSPLVPMTEDMGFLEVIPFSHKMGYLQHKKNGPGFISEDAPQEGWISIPMEIGDVLFFSAFTLHRSGNNTTEKIRLSCSWRYNNLIEDKYVARNFHQPFIYQRTEQEFIPNHNDIVRLFE